MVAIPLVLGNKLLFATVYSFIVDWTHDPQVHVVKGRRHTTRPPILPDG